MTLSATSSAAALPFQQAIQRPRRLLSIIFLLAVACIAVAPGWWPGRILANTDSLKAYAPWSTDPGYRPSNEFLLDQTMQFVPWMKYGVDRVHHAGHWVAPLWNPHAGLGEPFIGNGQSAWFYPTTLLHILLPPTWSWTISAALRLWIAGIGAWLLARHYRIRPVVDLLPAIAFMLCGFNIVWLNHPHSNVSIWLPWAVLMTELLILRVTPLRIAGMSAVIGIAFLGGHPATCIHLVVTCGLVYLLRLVWINRKAARRVLISAPALAIAVGIGFAAAAVQWLPLMEYVHNSGATVVRDATLRHSPHWASAFLSNAASLLGIFFPYLNGYPPDRITPFLIHLATHLPSTNELAHGWCGLMTVLLAGLAIFARGRENFGDPADDRNPQKTIKLWMAIASICALIAIRTPGLQALIDHVPGLNVAQNVRLLLSVALALSILAGFGLEYLLDHWFASRAVRNFRGVLKWMAIVLAALAVIGVLALLALKGAILHRAMIVVNYVYYLGDQSEGHEYPLAFREHQVILIYWEMVLTAARLLIPAAAMAIGYLVVRQSRRLIRSAWPWIGIVLAELLAFGVFYNPASPKSTYYPDNVAAIQFLQARQAEAPYRFAGTFHTFLPDTSTPYHLDDVRSYDAVGPYRRWLWSQMLDDEDFNEYLIHVNHPKSDYWQLMAMRYLITAPSQPPLPPPWKQVYPAAGAGVTDAKIYENPGALPRARIVDRVEVADTAEKVYERLAKPWDFDPHHVGLIDREVAPEFAAALAQELQRTPGLLQLARTASAPPATVAFLDPPAIHEQKPELVRIGIHNADNGWLILADNYFPGWQATILDKSQPAAKPKSAVIFPAFGTLRAVHLPPSADVEVVFQYRPQSFQTGIKLTLTGLSLLGLLTIAGFFRPK